VLTHSQARAPPPKTPHAAHPGPISEHEPLPTQLLFFLLTALAVGHEAPLATHWPLQMIEGDLHLHSDGFPCGKGVNPSVQVNPQGFPSIQAGVLWSGY
jgi:hypothetical protein